MEYLTLAHAMPRTHAQELRCMRVMCQTALAVKGQQPIVGLHQLAPIGLSFKKKQHLIVSHFAFPGNGHQR